MPDDSLIDYNSINSPDNSLTHNGTGSSGNSSLINWFKLKFYGFIMIQVEDYFFYWFIMIQVGVLKVNWVIMV